MAHKVNNTTDKTTPLHAERIFWLDHCSYTESQWRELDELLELEPVECETIGFVIKETKDYITVVSTVSANSKMLADILILKPTIISRKKLK